MRYRTIWLMTALAVNHGTLMIWCHPICGFYPQVSNILIFFVEGLYGESIFLITSHTFLLESLLIILINELINPWLPKNETYRESFYFPDWSKREHMLTRYIPTLSYTLSATGIINAVKRNKTSIIFNMCLATLSQQKKWGLQTG